ncbi:unnamed protein product [Rhizophagus irregularis]|uniref:Store-operated calcium entry-associated regulatory factor n=1 Tax=Rhizophagus irregularis TaxID=588596 RepID=A0A2N1P1X3_9GLOM|nr:DUF1183-domain-containing protein [Rhizophagus irregularis]CAB4400241.1 unnamed protein product [Rhizophagus irregularis]CAB5378201.1 unnamed protein product [Rhizophagus irregularis]
MKIQIVSSVISVILISLCLLTFVVEGWDNKVLLEKVRALTLYRGKYTTGRRHKPIKQIECIGGNAGCRYEPDVIQCRNIGLDGINPNWKCEADLPKSLKFGRLKVTCEGYEHPNDQYVLKGSCGLKYTLYLTNDYTNDRKKKQWFNNWFDNVNVDDDEDKSLFSTLFGIAWLGMIGYILYNMYLSCMRTRRGNNRNNRPTNVHSQEFRTSDDGAGESPRLNRDSSSSSTRRAYRRENIPYPGFWTGILGGGLTGYLFGRRNNNNNNYFHRRTRKKRSSPSYSTSSINNNSYDYYDWNNDYSDYSSTTTTASCDYDDTYTAYGFAETDNR